MTIVSAVSAATKVSAAAVVAAAMTAGRWLVAKAEKKERRTRE